MKIQANKKKKSPKAKWIAKGKLPSIKHVRDRFYGRLGKDSPAFYKLLCEELDYCGNQFRLSQQALEKIILFFLAVTTSIYMLLAELIFLMQKHFMNKFCSC
ncbi:MAG TPA: hypothetical protein ENG83_09210 [Nitrospirae bacterium]|nr:hypothetical protein [Nitrospirota bacterium]HDZ00109.1 hypothetical protein [Nitrospirota bacterium]